MYCGSEYGKIMWKLQSMPMKTIISDASRICLQTGQYKGIILLTVYGNFNVVNESSKRQGK